MVVVGNEQTDSDPILVIGLSSPLKGVAGRDGVGGGKREGLEEEGREGLEKGREGWSRETKSNLLKSCHSLKFSTVTTYFES